jgi:hypothetical protein
VPNNGSCTPITLIDQQPYRCNRFIGPTTGVPGTHALNAPAVLRHNYSRGFPVPLSQSQQTTLIAKDCCAHLSKGETASAFPPDAAERNFSHVGAFFKSDTGAGWPDLVVAAIMAALALQGAATVVRQALAELPEGKAVTA